MRLKRDGHAFEQFGESLADRSRVVLEKFLRLIRVREVMVHPDGGDELRHGRQAIHDRYIYRLVIGQNGNPRSAITGALGPHAGEQREYLRIEDAGIGHTGIVGKIFSTSTLLRPVSALNGSA